MEGDMERQFPEALKILSDTKLLVRIEHWPDVLIHSLHVLFTLFSYFQYNIFQRY